MSDERFMEQALSEAALASGRNEVPVGAVVVVDGRVVAAAHNRVIGLADPTGHAEILALRQAASATANYRLEGATLYVTLEPCLMCASAMVHARIARLVYGAPSPKFGYTAVAPGFFDHPALNHRVEVRGEVMARECGALLQGFFGEKR